MTKMGVECPHSGWVVVPGKHRVHVVPKGDLREHIRSKFCWCSPDIDEDGNIIHNAADRREDYEQKTRQTH